MGIPAYYKRLIDGVKGLVRRSHPNGGKVDWLWMDFNCMIYHCLRRPGIGSSYPGERGRIEWEESCFTLWEPGHRGRRSIGKFIDVGN